MSDREAEDGQNTRLLRALLWAGVGLAPIAALLALVGDGGPTRFGVLLLAVAVVLLGAALLVRNDPVLLSMDAEDRVAAEVSALRSELRGEIAAVSTMAAAPGAALPGPGPSARAAVRPPSGAAAVRPPSGASAAVRPAAASAAVPEFVASAEPDDGYGFPPAQPVAGYARAVAPAPSYDSPDPHDGQYDEDEHSSARHVPSAPGWPDMHPRPGGGAVGAAAPVPGQRARAAAAVPMAPVFQAPPAPASRTYGAPAENRSYGAPGDEHTYGSRQDQGGRRRADVTAVDLGYTGRRAKPDHAAADDGPSEWDERYGDPEPGYPGWAEADEHHGADAEPLNGQYQRRGW